MLTIAILIGLMVISGFAAREKGHGALLWAAVAAVLGTVWAVLSEALVAAMVWQADPGAQAIALPFQIIVLVVPLSLVMGLLIACLPKITPPPEAE